jgi:hypothetical protein
MNTRHLLQWGIRYEYSAHALFHRDLRQGVAHAVVRACAEVGQSGSVGPQKAVGVEMIGFGPRRGIAPRGGKAEKDHRAGRNSRVVQLNWRHGRARDERDTGLQADGFCDCACQPGLVFMNAGEVVAVLQGHQNTAGI